MNLGLWSVAPIRWWVIISRVLSLHWIGMRIFINAQQTCDTNISRLPSPLTMADSVKTCDHGFDPNPAIFGLGVSRYLSNRTSGIYWSSVVTDILLLYSSPRCSGACQVDFFKMADSWNWTRKPGNPANTGDLERRYRPGCQCAGLADYSCYPNCRGESHSLPCISGHKPALSAEHIVSILSVQSYVLCLYLYSGLTSGTQRTLLSVDDGFISSPWYYSQSSPFMWVWTRGRSALNLNAITQSKLSGSPAQWQRASTGSGDSGLPSSSSTSQWPLFMGCSWDSSGTGRRWVQHRERLFVGMDYSCWCKCAKYVTSSTTAYQTASHLVSMSFLLASLKQRYVFCTWLWDISSTKIDVA